MNILGEIAVIKIEGPKVTFEMSDGERLIIEDRGDSPASRQVVIDGDADSFLGAQIIEVDAGWHFSWSGNEGESEDQEVIVTTDKGKIVLMFEHGVHQFTEVEMSIWAEYKDEEERIA